MSHFLHLLYHYQSKIMDNSPITAKEYLDLLETDKLENKKDSGIIMFPNYLSDETKMEILDEIKKVYPVIKYKRNSMEESWINMFHTVSLGWQYEIYYYLKEF